MTVPRQHALSVDVEDWNEAFGRQGLPARLQGTESRIEQASDLLLELLERHRAKATCFVLGTVASRTPAVVRRIAAAGHRVGSHGWEHRCLDDSNPALLARHLTESRKLLQDLSGQPVLGFRAPWFSLRSRTAWAQAVIQEAGFTYDSSLFPVWNPFYGVSGAPLEVHRLPGGLHEVPPSAVELGPLRLPIAGGIYWRLLPFSWLNWGIDRLASLGRPAVLYLHPWELDTGQPRVWMGPMSTAIHYLNLSRTARVLESILGRWSFAPIEEVFPQVNSAA
ncbi:MAG: DUF3473 domain-containing protein [Candidatus Wallbacteria bacterium]|nr:DUF3473 domain-containing protein [Candidatus Wallbacteria bacterium]